MNQFFFKPRIKEIFSNGEYKLFLPYSEYPYFYKNSLFQFYVSEGRLSCQLYQRSADIFLGVPFNIASYALLTMMMAQATDLQPGEFIHTLGDAHIYSNHIDQADEQLTRMPYPLPQIKINPDIGNIFDFDYQDFSLEGYKFHPHIPAAVAV